MASVIDVKTLSKQQQLELVMDILKCNSDLKSQFHKILPIPDDELSMEYIEKLIDQDFERYDEVFRKLA
jgi:hypothetical protein